MTLRRSPALVALLAIVGALLILPARPAHAGDAARHCEWYYSQGDRSSPWKFYACVKLIHDASAHTWHATASVQSNTPGIYLVITDLHLHLDGVDASPDATGRGDGDSTFATTVTNRVRCGGNHSFDAVVLAHAIWPNGRASSYTRTWTEPSGFRGNC